MSDDQPDRESAIAIFIVLIFAIILVSVSVTCGVHWAFGCCWAKSLVIGSLSAVVAGLFVNKKL